MQVNYTGRNNLEITPAIKEHTVEKLQRLERHHANITSINMVFQVQNNQHIAEATVLLKGTDFHASATSADMYRAIDDLIDKIIAQITKHKERETDRHR